MHRLISVSRSSEEPAWGGLVVPLPSAPAAAQTAQSSACPGHPLPRPAQAAHRTAACHSGGFRCVKVDWPLLSQTVPLKFQSLFQVRRENKKYFQENK